MKNILFNAAYSGNLKKLKNYLAQGIDINSTDNNGKSALHRACEGKHRYTVRFLLRAGADVNLADLRGVTPLMLACLHSQKDIITLLLKHGADIKRVSDWGGVLSHATGAGNPEIIRMLIQAGADVNERSIIYSHETPLFCACRNGRLDIAKILVEAGADVNACNLFEETPLEEICVLNQADTPARLRATYPSIIRYLVEHGADVNKQDEFGSVLMSACDTAVENAAEIVQILLEAGADPAYTNKDGQTALDIAKLHQNNPIIQLLRAKSSPSSN